MERLGRAAQVPGRVFGLERPADDHPAERGKLRQEAGTRNAGERTKTFFFFIILVKSSLDCRPNSEQFDPVTVLLLQFSVKCKLMTSLLLGGMSSLKLGRMEGISIWIISKTI